MKKRSAASVLICLLVLSAMGFTGCSDSGGGKGSGDAGGSGKGAGHVLHCSLGSVASETSVQTEAAKLFAEKVKDYTEGIPTDQELATFQAAADRTWEDMKPI